MSALADLQPETVLRSYFHAKDENQPHMLERVFEAAWLASHRGSPLMLDPSLPASAPVRSTIPTQRGELEVA